MSLKLNAFYDVVVVQRALKIQMLRRSIWRFAYQMIDWSPGAGKVDRAIKLIWRLSPYKFPPRARGSRYELLKKDP